tara:strand:+ start:2547 stop:9641 length:7095 start_codon:yes stop_codon:yes gene_type:complete
MSEELYKDFDYQPIIDISREFYGNQIPKGFNEEQQKEFLYNKARSVDSTLPEYKHVKTTLDDYPSDSSQVDTSLNTVNSIFNAMDDISNEQVSYLNLAKSKNISPQKLSEELKSKPFKEIQELNLNPPPFPSPILMNTADYVEQTGKVGSIFESLVDPDSWTYLDKAKHKGLKDAIKVGLNQSIPAMHYNIKSGKDIYDVNMEEYNPNAIQIIAENMASMSDPLSILSFFGSYGLGGKFGAKAWRGLKTMPSTINRWIQKSTGSYTVKSIPKSKSGNSIKKKVLDYVAGEGSDKLAFGISGFGGASAVVGAINSASQQRMNRGKYSTNNGTINPWDTMNDSWKSFKDGATTGFLLTGTGQALGVANIWGNASWKMGQKNLKTLSARILGSTPSQLGIQGTIFTTMPIALDDEVRKSYYDKDGNFMWKKYAVNNLVSYPVIGMFWGINKLFIPKTQYKYNNDPNWHTKKGAKIEGLPAPRNINFGTEIRRIQSNIVSDIKYENNKLIDKNYRSAESNMLQESMNNIKGELGLKTPFEFFDKDLSIETELIETVDGLKELRNIVDNTVKILDKAGIKNNNGEYTGVEIDKLTENDIAYLTYITPTGLNAYQGYRLKNFETDEGKQEYIKRYEKENNTTLSDIQRKAVLKAQESRIKRYDILKSDINKTLLEGISPQEQIKKDKSSELDLKNKDVILVDENGKALNGNIISIDKESAEQGIEKGELKSVVDAKKEGIETKEIPSVSFGRAKEAKAELKELLREVIKEEMPVGQNIPKTSSQIKEITKDIKGDELTNIVKSKASVSNIKNPYDIAMLTKSFSSNELNKRIPIVNKILGASGHKSIADITSKDVKNYLDKAKQSPTKKIKGIDPNTTSNIKLIFQNLIDEGYLTKNPMTAKMQKAYTSEYNELMTAEKEPLPELKTWFNKIPQIKKAMKNDKNFIKGFEIIGSTPIRAEELNALKGIHIKIHPPTGKYYIDLTKPRSAGGAAKARGVKRPVWISKERAFELQSLAKKNPNKLLFPDFTYKLTSVSKKVVGDVTSKAYKKQEKTFAERQANLTPSELDVYNVIAGHAEPKDPTILKYYKEQENWGDLFKLQEQVLKKVEAAKQEFMKEPGITDVVAKGIEKVVEGLKKPGLSIEDVSGKSNKDVIKTVKDASKDAEAQLSDDVKLKLVNSIKNVWNELTKDMQSSEKGELMRFYAQSAGIEDYANFVLNKKTSPDELILFSDQIIDTKRMKAVKRKQIARTLKNVTEARDIMELNNISANAQKELIRDMFYTQDTPLDKISELNLTYDQSREYLSYIHAHPNIKNMDRFEYVNNALNTETMGKISRQLFNIKKPSGVARTALLTFGFYGQVPNAFKFLAKKLNAPELNKISNDLVNHQVTEAVQGAKLRQFEHNVYKIIYKNHVKKGINTAIRMIDQPTTLPRRNKRMYMYGKKFFDKKVKNNIWTLAPERYPNLVEHVKNNPSDKVAAKRLKDAKKFYEGVYNIKEMSKKENKGKLILRIDTLESEIAKEYYRLMRKDVMDNVLLSIQSNMTEAQWKSFNKKYPIKWIRQNFFVPRTITSKFGDEYDLTNQNIERRLEKGAIKYATEMAQKKYNKQNVTSKQVEEFKDKGIVEAYKDIVAEQSYGGKRYNPRHLLRRKVYLGERIKTKKGKWIDVYENKYDNYIPNYIASQAKLIANIEHFPYLVKIPGMKFNSSLPKVLAEVSLKGGVIGNYVNSMISSRTGLRIDSNSETHPMINASAGLISSLNKYLVRANLTTIKSPIKNFLLALNMNSLMYDLPQVLYYQQKAMDFQRRMEAKETGMMGISYTAITEGDNNYLSKIFEKMFTTGRFPTSEEIGRTTSIYLALAELPMMVDGIRRADPKWIRRAESHYLLRDIKDSDGDSDISLLKKYGLSDVDVDWQNEGSIAKKGVKAKRFKMVDGSEMTAFERAKKQRKIDNLHSKILMQAHQQTQGTIEPIFQPWAMSQPLIKSMALYSQTAISASHKLYNGFKENYKNKNWHRFAQYFGTIGLGSSALLAINTLLKHAPDPGELDTVFWKKWARKLHNMEQGAIHSWIWGVIAGVNPLSNPYLPAPAIQQGKEVYAFVLGLLQIAAEKSSDIDTNSFSRYLMKTKTWQQSGVDLGKAISGAYRDWRQTFLNRNNKYYKIQQEIDSNERTYKKEVKPISYNPVAEASVMADEYRAMKEAFEMSDNMNLFNETVIGAWWNKYHDAIETGNETPDGAAQKATQAINQKIVSLNPILNGVGRKKGTKWFSERMRYFLYLKEKAVKQGKDKNPLTEQDKANIIKGNINESIQNKVNTSPYVIRALKQEIVFDARIKVWEKQWSYFLRKNYKQDDYKKYWSKIHSSTWDKLGISPK